MNMIDVGYFLNKRFKERKDFTLDIYYPCVNNESVYTKYNNLEPLLKAINISETGICFVSRISLKEGDFISFLNKIGNNPSFWCLSQVRWVRDFEKLQIVGCEFFLLNQNQVEKIRSFTDAQMYL